MFGKKKVVLEKKENTMLELSRAEILDRFRKSLAEGNILLGVGAGTGITAKSAEAGGADIFVIYNSGRFRMAGRGSLAGLLSYGDANQIVVEMGAEVLPVVKDTPVLAGVCGTDPFRVMKKYLAELKDQGFNGVQNFPTVGLIDGVFRKNLEETGMGYGLEVDMIAEAHKLDMLTCPYVFDEEQAAAMTKAGADIIVAHMGLTTGGTIGAETARTLDDCVEIITGIVKVVKDINPDALVICHGGPISEPKDAAYVIDHVPGIDGFFGATSIERLAAEPVERVPRGGRGRDGRRVVDGRTGEDAERLAVRGREAEQRAERGERHAAAGVAPRLHEVRCRLVPEERMRHRADDRVEVGALRQLGHPFVELDAGVRLDRLQAVVVVMRRVRLGVERLQLRGTAPEPDLDDALGELPRRGL